MIKPLEEKRIVLRGRKRESNARKSNHYGPDQRRTTAFDVSYSDRGRATKATLSERPMAKGRTQEGVRIAPTQMRSSAA